MLAVVPPIGRLAMYRLIGATLLSAVSFLCTERFEPIGGFAPIGSWVVFALFILLR